MKKEEQQIQILADQLQSFLMLVDAFVENLTDEDYSLLEKSKHTLQSNINIKESVATLTTAFGIKQDTTEERYKIKTIDAIINLFDVRKKYHNEMIERIEKERKKQQSKKEIMQALGLME